MIDKDNVARRTAHTFARFDEQERLTHISGFF